MLVERHPGGRILLLNLFQLSEYPVQCADHYTTGGQVFYLCNPVFSNTNTSKILY